MHYSVASSVRLYVGKYSETTSFESDAYVHTDQMLQKAFYKKLYMLLEIVDSDNYICKLSLVLHVIFGEFCRLIFPFFFINVISHFNKTEKCTLESAHTQTYIYWAQQRFSELRQNAVA